MLKPELFRVAIDTTEAPVGTPLPSIRKRRPGASIVTALT